MCPYSRSSACGLDVYTGTLIKDLFASVERAERAAAARSRQSAPSQAAAEMNTGAMKVETMAPENRSLGAPNSQPEKLAQSLRLSPADWNFALLLIVHAQLIGTLEPGHDFPNTIDVHQIRPVSPPEQAWIQAGK